MGAGTEVGGEGGTGGDGGTQNFPPAPPLRNPVDMEDEELAYQSLILMGKESLGATSDTCSECHSLNRNLLTQWKDLSDVALSTCFSDTAIETSDAATDALNCLRIKPDNVTSPFVTTKLGIYSAAAHLEWFDAAFDRAYGPIADAKRTDFMQIVAMPKQHEPFSQAQFDIVAEWFVRGLPFLDEFLPDDPPPNGCEPTIGPDVATHVAEMATSGWRVENAENGILNFGCAQAATPLDCLATYPRPDEFPYSTGWEHMPDTKLRILRTNMYNSSFWTRSSADGRYVGHGGGLVANSTIVDLQENLEIGVQAAYDPGFMPDNSGFIFQGTPGGAGLCQQSLLENDTQVSFSEPECNSINSIGLYQHVGATLGGGDYWTVDGYFTSDNGGNFPGEGQPSAFFGSDSTIDLTPFIYDGSNYVPKPRVRKDVPFEGDTVISPSGRLLMSRVGGGNGQTGFQMRKMVATPNGQSYDVEIPKVAMYCIDGGKPGFSYDERWVVIHRYVTGDDAVELGFTGPGDPGFAEYANQGAANLYLLDLVTGLVRRVTHMKPGQYALFPHFRSDGWIYFMVRTINQNHEFIVASDAALTLE